jgi:hypothetical protein
MKPGPCFAWLPAAAALALLCAPARAAGPSGPLPVPPQPIQDYQAKGNIQVTIPEISLVLGFEQSYVAPDTVLFGFEMDALKRWWLVSGDRERTYNPGAAFLIERRYRNLDKLPFSPSAAVQMSMAHYARVIRELKSAQLLGSEQILGKPCWRVRFSNQELTQTLLAKGIIGDVAAKYLAKGVTQAWLTQAQGLPLRIQICDADGNPAVSFTFTKLQINSGLQAAALRIPAPPNAMVLSTTCDVTQPDWEKAADDDIERQVTAIQEAQRKQANQGSPNQVPVSRGQTLSPPPAADLKPAKPGRKRGR